MLRLSLAIIGVAFSALAAPSHGPSKGYLIISGGAPDYKRFLELAGGKNAHIVVIPTASITSPTAIPKDSEYCSPPGPFAAFGPFAGLPCVVLHTINRKIADSAAFVAPLRDATGVWIEGGRHWRLTDAYLDTRTLKELFNLLDRGGVIGGGSAGATIQGSYMVRASSNPDDNTIMMAPGHEIGFGFFTNVTIDQLVDTRHRENDLAPVMKAHPELLGLGLDASTSITVHGDVMIVNGPKRVAVWDGKDHDGKGYYYLRAGDTLNTVTRVATIVEHPVRREITCVEEATARSPNVATQTVDIRITNQRSNASNIYWLNQQGQRVFYRTLDSGAFYTQPTYSEHPWVATDNDEHCTMFFVATTAPHQEVTIRSPDGKIEGLLLGQPATTSHIRVEANVQAPNLIRKSHPYTKFGPDRWPKDELNHYIAMQNVNHYIAMQNGFDSEARKRIEPERSAVASKAMIAGTSEPLAIHAGLDVLRHGGNAADAALTTSLAQIALTAGATVSYAGIMTVVYYDAATGKVHTLNASYNTVQNEKDPLSIPGVGEHSGRTVLVPGYMAGVQALHDRFGRLPFSMLFGPAIWIAENGVVVSPIVNAWISSQKTFVTRLPETKRIFTKPDGELYKTGDLFRQLELAATLKKIAAQGSTYIYKGEWAHHFVDIAQREGGKITLEDLAAYRPLWTEPLQASYADYQVVLLGPPNTGGFITLGGLGLAEVAGLKKSGHYTTSAEALYNLIQIERTTQAFANASPSTRQKLFPEVEPSLESLLTRKAAERFWAGIQRKMVPPPAEDPSPHHTAGIVAVDEQGNVACILHSINAILWGATGIFVDGISIPDSAVFQQRAILVAGPGMRLPEPTNPLIVLKGGKPVLASVATSSGLHNVTLENLINILDFGMDPQTAVNQPNTQGPFLGVIANAPGKPEYEKEAIVQGEFPQSVIDGVVARGQAIKLVDKHAQPGFWIGIQVDPLTHKLRGAGTPLSPALVEGY